ncbi:MAG: anti-sigma factor family protein [Vicinamibacterales bacterium]
MLTCREIADFLMDYVSGLLPADRLAEFESHLAICPACVDYLRSYKATIRMSREAFDSSAANEVSPDVPEELVRAILAARGRS